MKLNTFSRLLLVALIAALPFSADSAARKPLVIGSTGQQQQISATDTLLLPAATTANASLNLPHGTAPTAPSNGDCWTTSTGLFCRISGATVGPMGTGAGNAIANSKLLGSGSSGSGSPYSEITLGTGLSMSGTTLSASGGGGGGCPGGTPTVRTSNVQSSSAASYTVSFGAGAAAGDVYLIFFGGGFQVTTPPTGWAILAAGTGSNFNGTILGKVLSSGDVSTGSVVVTPASTFNSVVIGINFVGSTVGAIATQPIGVQNGSGVTSTILTMFGVVCTTTEMLYFGGTRGAANVTVSVGGGTSIQAVNAASASGALYGGTNPGGLLGLGATYNFSLAGSGYYVAMIAISGV